MRNDISLGILISFVSLSFSLSYYILHERAPLENIVLSSIVLGLIEYKILKEIIRRRKK